MVTANRKASLKAAARAFRVLGSESRIQIVERLKKGWCAVGTLAEELGVTPSAVSQHLAVLKAAGLVIDEREGSFIKYCVIPDALTTLQKVFDHLCDCG